MHGSVQPGPQGEGLDGQAGGIADKGERVLGREG